MPNKAKAMKIEEIETASHEWFSLVTEIPSRQSTFPIRHLHTLPNAIYEATKQKAAFGARGRALKPIKRRRGNRRRTDRTTGRSGESESQMVSDLDLVTRLQEILRRSDLDNTTAGGVRRQLEEDFGVDLSDRRAFIRHQIDAFLQTLQKNQGEDEPQEEDDAGDVDELENAEDGAEGESGDSPTAAVAKEEKEEEEDGEEEEQSEEDERQ